MRSFRIFFLIGLATLLVWTPVSLAKSQKQLTSLYGFYLKGLFYLEKGEYTSGLEELEKAKARDTQSVHIRLKIATVLIRLNRIEEAEGVLKEAKKVEPNNLDVSLALIFVYSYAQKDEALENEYENFLKRAHELKPKDVGISEYLAQFYFYKKRPQKAIEIYNKILEHNPKYVSALFWLGYLHEEAGNRDEAVTAWKKGLKIDPAYAPILNYLGDIYAVEGINLDEAETMIKKALEKEPENGAYLDSLGWVYFQKGDIKKAEEYLTKAISYIKDPEIYEHLGDLYIKLGDNAKGVDYYREGLTHFPDYKGLKNKLKEYEGQGKGSKE